MKHVETMIKLGHIAGSHSTTWSFGKDATSSRQNSKDEFCIHLGRALRPTKTFKAEAIQTAVTISDRAAKPITIFASGGLDSEVVIKSFLEANRPFEIVAFDMSSMNRDELAHLDRFCRSHQISYRKHHIDVAKFLENDLESIARQSGSTSPEINTLLYGLSQIDGHVVLGDGETSLHRIGNTFFEVWQERHSYARWMLINQREGCPSFFSHSPELELATYLDPIVEDFTKVAWHILDSRHFDYCKPFLYYHHFGTRIREKIDTFKPIEELEAACYLHLQKILPGADSEVRISYEQLTSYLTDGKPMQKPVLSAIENGRRLQIG